MKFAPFLLALAGLGLALHGAWIPIKAEIAQVLLDRAWRHALDGEETAKPWPWADTWPVARLRAPGHGIDHVVLEGASGSVLAFAPGRIAGTGTASPLALAGHRDTHFAFLRDLALGDALEVERRDGTLRRYRVVSTRVVDHRDTAAIEGPPGSLVLVTCWPFDATFDSLVGGGPLRYVVEAVSFFDEPELAPESEPLDFDSLFEDPESEPPESPEPLESLDFDSVFELESEEPESPLGILPLPA